MKDIGSQGGRGVCPVQTFCGQRGFFRYGRPHFLARKTLGFSEIYGVSERTRGEEGPIFRYFVRTYFMNGPLWHSVFCFLINTVHSYLYMLYVSGYWVRLTLQWIIAVSIFWKLLIVFTRTNYGERVDVLQSYCNKKNGAKFLCDLL